MTAAVRDWDLLLHRHLEGALTEEEGRALSARLLADAPLRRRLAEMAFDQAQYREIFQTAESEPIVMLPAREAPPARSGKLLAVAAAALFLVVGGSILWMAGGPEAAYELVSGEVREEAGRLHVAGQTPAVLRLGGDSRVELMPGSAAAVRSPAVVELVQGSGRFQVEPGTGPFRVDLPVGSVTALGTRFEVDLTKLKRQKSPFFVVTVSLGKVSVDVRGKATTLGAGESRLFEAGEPRKAPGSESWKGFSGVLYGRLGARDEEGTLFTVERITRGGPADALVGRSIRLTLRSRNDTGEMGSERSGELLERFGSGASVSLEVRHAGGDLFEVVESKKVLHEEKPESENREK